MLKRTTWPFDFVILVCCAFVFLTLGAMALYPGGTALDPHATSYHFFENYFSDLGRTVSRRSGKSNPFGSFLFFIALSGAGVALGVFFVAFARFFWNGLAQRVVTAAGVLFGLLTGFNFLGIAWVRANIDSDKHVQFVFAAFKTFPLAVFFFAVAIFLGGSYPRRGAWIFIAFFGVLLAYLCLITAGPPPTTAFGLMMQVTGQKVVVYASLLCVGAQAIMARRHLNAQSRSKNFS